MGINSKVCKDWYLGLDIGTDSVGWAVTDEYYRILKYKNNGMWGVMLFEGGKTCEERRIHRTNRRRLERRKQRINMLQEFFADEIFKKDDKFYIRLKESALYSEDKTVDDKFELFNGNGMTDCEYYKKYPTIHHLICELMESEEYHDVRLVYIACSYILSHRGHFLKEIDKNNIEEVTQFENIYDDFVNFYNEYTEEIPWECGKEEFKNILKKNITITAKEKEFKKLLWGGKKADESNEKISPNLLIKLISGGKIKFSELFNNNSYSELESMSLGMSDFDEKLNSISLVIDDEEIELIKKCKALYDWSVLSEMLAGKKYISEAKKEVYEIHKNDLRFLKGFIKKYIPEKYDEIFRKASKTNNNYVNYVYNIKSAKIVDNSYKKVDAEAFCKYIKSIFKAVKDLENIIADEDKSGYEDMIRRLETNSFCPKQKTGNNRVIPYQLYWIELKKILDNASKYMEFLNNADEYGTVKDKILSIMEFRIPYYVGPLVSADKSKFAWMVRKIEGKKICPWNFDDVVDKDKSEEAFIRRMTCKCTYIAGEDVLPKNSLLYSKFTVLNEINNIKVNDKLISVECKQKIYEELFMKKRKVTHKDIENFLISNNYMSKDDSISGIDTTIKSSLKSYNDFKRLIKAKILNEDDVEKIIERITFTKEKTRIKRWLKNEFNLSEEELNYVSKLKYDDFGRLSARLLTEINDIDRDTGEIKNPSIISMMWQENINFMQLLSDRYSYAAQIKDINNEYYGEREISLKEKLDNMYISNSVRRSVIRTMDIVNELKKIMKCPPKKIFVEMARGGKENQKGNRTKSRYDKISELYENVCSDGEIGELRKLLESKSESDLRRDELYLYFMQFGKSMYSNTPLDIEKLGTKAYEIDHIYPRSKVKDDSIDNRVLVLAKENKDKGDKYPIAEEIRINMCDRWEMLAKIGAISEKKLKRLKRESGFTDEELADFINRQIVETRQSTKAVAYILGDMFENTEIVYVKAGLVSDFRHKFDIIKSREVNDFHHAKDAYLNIVMGNVYNVKFTKNPLNFIKEVGKGNYSMKIDVLLKHDIERNGEIAWKGNGETLKIVKDNVSKNNIRFVRYAACQKGELFDAQLLRKGKGQVPVKGTTKESINKYGGYNRATIAFFYLIKYTKKKKRVTTLLPIELYMSERLNNVNKVMEYCRDTLKMENPEMLLNGRKIKYNSLWEIDGFRAHLTSKSNKTVRFKGGMQLIVGYEWENYIKKLNIFKDRYISSKKIITVTKYDNISKEKNIELYDLLTDKINNTQYKVLLKKATEVLSNGKDKFSELATEEQTVVLSNILMLFRCNSPDGTDLRSIGGVENSGIRSINMEINSKNFSEIYIIDQSPTGLREKKSPNLIEL